MSAASEKCLLQLLHERGVLGEKFRARDGKGLIYLCISIKTSRGSLPCWETARSALERGNLSLLPFLSPLRLPLNK